MSKKERKRLLLVGWDAADWSMIHSLIEKGLLPTVKRLLDQSAHGHLQTLTPSLSPMLWTSIITGKTADKHGVLGFTEPNPETGGIRPIQGTSRTAKTVWNILQENNYVCNTIHWWPSHPAEPTNGIFVSDHFARYSGQSQGRLRLPPGCILPLEHEQPLDDLRISPSAITEEHLLPFIPDLLQVDLSEDKHPEELAKVLAETSNVQAAATYAMTRNKWDFTAVYFEAIDSAAHTFMKYHPPQLAGTDPTLFSRYRGVMEGIYRFLDMCLERLVELAGPECAVLLVSDHGFFHDHRRHRELPKLIAAPMLEHKQYGVFLFSQPGGQKRPLFDLRIVDVAPAILSYFKLPVATDMDGQVPAGLFSDILPPAISSYEHLSGPFSGYPDDLRVNTGESYEMLQHLVELGYIDPPGEKDAENARLSLVYHKYNLSKVHASKGQWDDALMLLSTLIEENPTYHPFWLDKLDFLIRSGKLEDAHNTLQLVRDHSWFASELLRFIEIRLFLQEGKVRKALEWMEAFPNTQKLPVALQLEMGRIYVNANQIQQAEQLFTAVVEQAPENTEAYNGLSTCALLNETYEAAAAYALQALEYNFRMPDAHYNLGVALREMGKPTEAIAAFRQAWIWRPGLLKAAEALASLLSQTEQHTEEAAYFHKYLERSRSPVFVVSGLPRSGTSLTMHLLKQLGIPVFADGVRSADEYNPNGYYEHEAVKGSLVDVSWMQQAQGKAVKVVAPLVRKLPAKHRYKVIWLDRDPEEVMRSQLAMRTGKADIFDVGLRDQLQTERDRCLAFFEEASPIEFISLAFNEYFTNPASIAHRLATFLEIDVPEETVAKLVDPNLPRFRNAH